MSVLSRFFFILLFICFKSACNIYPPLSVVVLSLCPLPFSACHACLVLVLHRHGHLLVLPRHGHLLVLPRYGYLLVLPRLVIFCFRPLLASFGPLVVCSFGTVTFYFLFCPSMLVLPRYYHLLVFPSNDRLLALFSHYTY